jgi:YfiH family protein
MTADCLPVLLCDRGGRVVAAVHAGWRGLAAGVLERAVGALHVDPAQVIAWLGPAIGPDAFVVGPEVRVQLVAGDPGATLAFRPAVGGRWLADIYTLARRRLAGVGVNAVFGGGDCTFSDPGRFFSYRRDGVTGRMASLIWLAP